MEKAGVFVDGGYLTTVLKNWGAPRVDYHNLVRWTCSEEVLFRTYYYDCLPYQSAEPTPEERKRVSRTQKFFRALESGSRLTIRQGRLEYRGKNDRGEPIYSQKQVDLMLGVDIASHVVKDRINVVVIITGDSDFIPAVRFAQREGAIVRLVHGPIEGCHRDLWWLVDERKELTKSVIEGMPLKKQKTTLL